MFPLFPPLFLGRRGIKKKNKLHVIQSKAEYANDFHQQHDDDIQETPGTYVIGII